jgi:hypothetical protein
MDTNAHRRGPGRTTSNLVRRNLVRRNLGALAAGVVAAAAGSASGTWSIVLIDTRTGEVALGSATCLFSFDLQANTPVLLPGVGGATAQSSVDADGTNRVFIRDALLAGTDPAQILAGLATKEGGTHQTRQYGMGDVLGRTATFSGSSASAWAGGKTGRITQPGGDIIYAVQGNILTGEPVVQLAVDAIIATPGDLAAKLMAGMEAARSMGGDGRCSCAAGPTLCGSPPSTPWDRTAGIAYMLIAREEDIEKSTSVYKLNGVSPLAIADFSGDGKPDIAVGYTSNVGIMTNLRVGSGPNRFSPPRSIGAVNTPRVLFAGDVNADGKPDLVSASFTSSNNFSVFLGTGGGNFAPPVTISAGGTLQGLARADVDGDGDDDFVSLATGSPQIALIRNNGDGTFQAPVSTAVATGAGSIGLADANGDSKPDVLISYVGTRSIAVLLNNGSGTFTAGTPISVPSAPLGIDTGDIDGDGTLEILTTSTADRVLMLSRRVAGSWTTSSIPVGTGLGTGFFLDTNSDGKADLAVPQRSNLNSNGVLKVFPSIGDGTFAAVQEYSHYSLPTRALIRDMDGDGRGDMVLTMSTGGLVQIAQGTGTVAGRPRFLTDGTAAGDYYMEFNHPFTTPTTVDPVFLLEDNLSAWRSMLVDVPDAVRTEAVLSATTAPSTGAWPVTLDITLRDWRGEVVTRPMNVTVGHRGPDLRGLNASDGISTIGPVESLGNGRYRAGIRTGGACGLDRFRIAISDPATPDSRAIVCMPAPKLVLSPPGDVNQDGTVNSADVAAFLAGFDVEGLSSDVNGDGVSDFADFLAFFNFYDGGCGGGGSPG